MEDDLFELRQTILEPRLQVSVVEELRVGQPRADDALVAGDNRFAAVFRLDIGDQDELVDQLGVRGVAQHKAFLIVADGGADHLRRDIQKPAIERAHQHHRPLDQAGDFGEKAIVLDQFEPLREGEMLRLGEDDVAPPLGVEHHLGLVEFVLIIGEPAHGERLRRQKAVTARLVARRDAVDRKRHDVRLLGLRTERRHDGMQWPHPISARRALSSGRPSASISARESL